VRFNCTLKFKSTHAGHQPEAVKTVKPLCKSVAELKREEKEK